MKAIISTIVALGFVGIGVVLGLAMLKGFEFMMKILLGGF